MNGAKNDVLEKMTKAELILWIRENLFLRKMPRWSWVLGKRLDAAHEKAEKIRQSLHKIPEFNNKKYNLLAEKFNEEKNTNRRNKILNEMEILRKPFEARQAIYAQIDQADNKANNIWKQLEKEWENEKNERSKTSR